MAPVLRSRVVISGANRRHRSAQGPLRVDGLGRSAEIEGSSRRGKSRGWGACSFSFVSLAVVLGACQPHSGGAYESRPAPSAVARLTRAVSTAAEEELTSTAAPPRAPSPAQKGFAPNRAQERTWSFDAPELGRVDVVVLLPTKVRRDTPVLFLLHGRGESLKGPERGARGWLDDYGVLTAITRLKSPPLRAADFGGHVTRQRLAVYNRGLRALPYRDMVLVFPYVPNRFGQGALWARARDYAQLLTGPIRARLRSELGLACAAERTGIDGISLGGRVALVAGLLQSSAFGTVAASQAALDQNELSELVALTKAARDRNPALRLRLMTSHQDYFLDVNRDLSEALGRQGISHTLDVVSGDHSYEFNRGPGVFDILLFHARALRL